MKRTAAMFGSIAVYAMCAFPLSVGDAAPPFTLTTMSDSPVSLAQYRDQVCVLYFLCLGCGQERAAASAVEKHIWRSYQNRNLSFLCIERSNIAKDKVILTAKQWGITFPVAINGNQTASAYGTADRSIFLLDKNGLVQAFSRIPLATDTADPQVEAAVQSFAEKIPALLATAAGPRRSAAHNPVDPSTVRDNSGWTSDLKGRRIERTGAAMAPQRVIDAARSAGTAVRKK